MPLIRESLAGGQSVTISPRGTSMLPMIRQGKDRVVLSPLTGPLKKHDLPLYQRENGQYVLHRIVKARESYTCMGDNQFDPEPGVSQDQIIGVVTAFYRGDRKYAVTDWQYRLYCRYWYYSRPLRHHWLRVKLRLRRLFK